jgi:hypothetical protein
VTLVGRDPEGDLLSFNIVSAPTYGSLSVITPQAEPDSNAWYAEGNATDFLNIDNGTLVGGASFAAGRVGQGFSFDGVNDYVSFPQYTDGGTIGAFTFSLWAMATSGSDLPTFGVVGNGNLNDSPFASYSGGLNFGNGSNHQLLAALPNAQAGVWTHYAIVGDATNYHVYVNGIEVTNVVRTVSPNSAGPRRDQRNISQVSWMKSRYGIGRYRQLKFKVWWPQAIRPSSSTAQV